MPAYVISEVAVLDEAQGQRYRELAAASIARYGGGYIVRGAEPEVPEGDWPAAHRVGFDLVERLMNARLSAGLAGWDIHHLLGFSWQNTESRLPVVPLRARSN